MNSLEQIRVFIPLYTNDAVLISVVIDGQGIDISLTSKDAETLGETLKRAGEQAKSLIANHTKGTP